MTAFTPSSLSIAPLFTTSRDSSTLSALLKGEILLNTRPYTAWGGAVTARMYLQIDRAQAWKQLTNYPRWVEYFPALTRSEVLPSGSTQQAASGMKRLYQAASKNFLLFTAQVDIYLNVIETSQQHIQFCLESGSFNDFAADLRLQNCGDGTLLTYSVQATPTIPVPALLIEQAIQLDLPTNLRNLRQVLCR